MPVTQIVKEYPEMGKQEIFPLLTSIQIMLWKNNQNSQPKTYAGENGQSNFKPKQWDKKNIIKTSIMAYKSMRKDQTRATLNGQMIQNQNSSNDKALDSRGGSRRQRG